MEAVPSLPVFVSASGCLVILPCGVSGNREQVRTLAWPITVVSPLRVLTLLLLPETTRESDPFLRTTRHGKGGGRMRAATSYLFREAVWRNDMQISRKPDTLEKGLDFARPGGASSSDEGIASSGVTFILWRLYQHAWLVCLFFPLISLVREPVSTFHFVLGLFALSFFAASYTWLMWPHPASKGMRARTRPRLALTLLVVLALEVTGVSVMYGPAWLAT